MEMEGFNIGRMEEIGKYKGQAYGQKSLCKVFIMQNKNKIKIRVQGRSQTEPYIPKRNK
jgi:hypothetical protein